MNHEGPPGSGTEKPDALRLSESLGGETPSARAARGRRKMVLTLVGVLLLAGGVVGSLLVGRQILNTAREEERANFSGVCGEVSTMVADGLHAHSMMLAAMADFIAASPGAVDDVLQAGIECSAAGPRVPALTALGLARVVGNEELESLVAEIRRSGVPGYRVHPPVSRGPCAPVTLIVPPSAAGSQLLGYDLLSDPLIRGSIERFPSGGRTVMTGGVNLVRGPTTQDAPVVALILAPVPRDGPHGSSGRENQAWVFGILNIGDFIGKILRPGFLRTHHGFGLRIYEGDHVAGGRLLYEGPATNSTPGVSPLFHEERAVDFEGGSWLLAFDADPAPAALDYLPALAAGAAGVAMSLGLFGLFVLYGRRSDAHLMAEAEATQFRNVALHDSLTGLPNRLLLQDRLAMAVAASRRTGRTGALMVLDLDKFKDLNDRRGHACGDQLLIEVARRLRDCVRETDTVARLGGDEFVVVLPGLTDGVEVTRAEALAAARIIVASLGRPYRLGQEGPRRPALEHRCSCSVGIAMFSAADSDPDSILRRADAAMYRAKRSGRNRVYLDGGDVQAV